MLSLLLSGLAAQAQVGPNYRWIDFSGQTAPTVASYPATLTSNDGSVTMTVSGNAPIGFANAGNDGGPNPLAAPFVGAGNARTGVVVSQARSTATFTYQLGSQVVAQNFWISDQRYDTWTDISGDCMNAAGTGLEACDFRNLPGQYTGQTSGSGYCGTGLQYYDNSAGVLTLYTSPNGGCIQSDSYYVHLPANLRVLRVQVNHSGNTDFTIHSLSVADAPSVTKSFVPAAVQPGGQSTLTITLSNTTPDTPVPGVNVTDALPAPLQLVSATHTCTGGTLSATAGSSSVGLSGTTIPVAGCQITAQVQWPGTNAGIGACLATPSVTNTIAPPAQFNTALGQMGTAAAAELSCSYTAAQVSVACVPPTITDSPNQVSTCTVSSTSPAGPDGLSVNLNLPASNPRYTSTCASPLLIAAGATSASCTITATPNTVVGDGSVTATLSVAPPSTAGLYTVAGGPAQVEVQDDDKAVPAATPTPVPAVGGAALLLTSAGIFGVGAALSRQRRRRAGK